MPKLSFSKTVVVPAVIALLGLVAILAGVGFATIWKPSSLVDATVEAKDPVIVTRPGVLSLVNDSVKIVATAPADADVTVVVGRSADVIGWAAEQNWQEITGVVNSRDLSTEQHQSTQTKTAAKQASPLQSNMWLAKSSGKGKAELAWSQVDGQYSALVVSSQGTPKVSLQWTAQRSHPYFVPALTIGIILLLLAAVTWLIMRIVAQRQLAQARDAAAGRDDDDDYSPTIVIGEEVAPSRRALREARERGEAAIRVGEKEYPTGLIPVVHKVDGDAAASVAVAQAKSDANENTEEPVVVSASAEATETVPVAPVPDGEAASDNVVAGENSAAHALVHEEQDDPAPLATQAQEPQWFVDAEAVSAQIPAQTQPIEPDNFDLDSVERGDVERGDVEHGDVEHDGDEPDGKTIAEDIADLSEWQHVDTAAHALRDEAAADANAIPADDASHTVADTTNGFVFPRLRETGDDVDIADFSATWGEIDTTSTGTPDLAADDHMRGNEGK